MKKKQNKANAKAKAKVPPNAKQNKAKPKAKLKAKATVSANEPSEKKNLPPKKKYVRLWPLNLPLSEKWYTISDLMIMFNAKRGVIDRFRDRGLLRAHKWGRTVRFNKAYVDWMIENGGKKFTWFGWLLAVTHSFDWIMDSLVI